MGNLNDHPMATNACVSPADTQDPLVFLPMEVRSLFPREREIATIVYCRGTATAKSIESQLSSQLTNAAIRSMLQRLVRKGVLSRRKRKGQNKEFVYVPAITAAGEREKALRQFARDHFNGSLQKAALALVKLLKSERDAASQTVDLAA